MDECLCVFKLEDIYMIYLIKCADFLEMHAKIIQFVLVLHGVSISLFCLSTFYSLLVVAAVICDVVKINVTL